VSDAFEDEFDPAATTRSVLRWALVYGASTLGEAYDLLEQLEVSNDVPEVLGDDGRIEDVRDDLDLGLGLVGPDAALTSLV
jgi:hypothetical protein